MKEFQWRSLHFVTRLMVVATALHLAADVIEALTNLSKLREGRIELADLLERTGHSFGYSLLFLSSAATVELLFRIWREFRELRALGASVTPKPADDVGESAG